MDLKHAHVKRPENFLAKEEEELTIPMAKKFYTFLKRYGKKSPFMIAPDLVHGKGGLPLRFPKALYGIHGEHRLRMGDAAHHAAILCLIASDQGLLVIQNCPVAGRLHGIWWR